MTFGFKARSAACCVSLSRYSSAVEFQVNPNAVSNAAQVMVGSQIYGAEESRSIGMELRSKGCGLELWRVLLAEIVSMYTMRSRVLCELKVNCKSFAMNLDES